MCETVFSCWLKNSNLQIRFASFCSLKSYFVVFLCRCTLWVIVTDKEHCKWRFCTMSTYNVFLCTSSIEVITISDISDKYISEWDWWLDSSLDIDFRFFRSCIQLSDFICEPTQHILNYSTITLRSIQAYFEFDDNYLMFSEQLQYIYPT